MINIYKMPAVKTSKHRVEDVWRCGEDGDEEETICGKKRRENFCKMTLDDARLFNSHKL